MAHPPLQPTYRGYLTDTLDGLVLFEASLQGRLTHVARRPHDRERSNLIASGNIFIYQEEASGIRRWTDGCSWSPSRIMGNYLVYRELVTNLPPGEKKRALKRPANKRHSTGGIPEAEGGVPPNGQGSIDPTIRSMVGSLTDSYDFKEQGLVKKTISIQYRGITHHLVSYYTMEDVLENRLQSPAQDPNLQGLKPRPELLLHQQFRVGLSDEEWMRVGAVATNGYLAYPQPQPQQVEGPMMSYHADHMMQHGAMMHGSSMASDHDAVHNHGMASGVSMISLPQPMALPQAQAFQPTPNYATDPGFPADPGFSTEPTFKQEHDITGYHDTFESGFSNMVGTAPWYNGP